MNTVRFTKMHGLGNDYVYVDCTAYDPCDLPFDPAEVSRQVSPRHISVGSDGLILICRSSVADFAMRMFNADGSEGAMCGNGIRCVGKFIYDKGLSDSLRLDIETRAGIKHLNLIPGPDGLISSVTVDMGVSRASDLQLRIGGHTIDAVDVDIGNPHCVIFMDGDPAGLDLAAIGPEHEHHPHWPDGVNTEFVRQSAPGIFDMRVWERGSGETMACGTGACAVAAAAVLRGFVQPGEVCHIRMRYGELQIVVASDGAVTMTGPAVTAFEGTFGLK